MATKDQVRKRVLAHFRNSWPKANEKSDLRADLLLDDRQVLDIGTELAEELDCYPTRSQILACKTIGDLITLLIATSFHRVVAMRADEIPGLAKLAGGPRAPAARSAKRGRGR